MRGERNSETAPHPAAIGAITHLRGFRAESATVLRIRNLGSPEFGSREIGNITQNGEAPKARPVKGELQRWDFSLGSGKTKTAKSTSPKSGG